LLTDSLYLQRLLWSGQNDKPYVRNQSFADLERHVPVIKVHRDFGRPGDTIPAQNLLNLVPVSAPYHPSQPVQNFK
jgi:hypothetical protein